MIIRHWQGYGKVDVKKISDRAVPNSPDRVLKVKVSGNHECGLVRDDKYDVFAWMLKSGERFLPKGAMTDWRQIHRVMINESYDDEKDVETATYEILYTPNRS